MILEFQNVEERSKIKNYRPVGTLSVVSKVLISKKTNKQINK